MQKDKRKAGCLIQFVWEMEAPGNGLLYTYILGIRLELTLMPFRSPEVALLLVSTKNRGNYVMYGDIYYTE